MEADNMQENEMSELKIETAVIQAEQAREAWQKPVLSRAEISFDTASHIGSGTDAEGETDLPN
jgi:hypothetical protein